MIFGYIRVSSDRQTVDNQRYEIQEYCKREGIAVDRWIEETISGTRAYGERKLGELLAAIDTGDTILCTELSRLGRNLFMIMEILNGCMEKGCCVQTIKEGYRLTDDLQSKVLAFSLGLCAEVERDMISTRTREALARRKAEGQILGRPRGRRSTTLNSKCTARHAEIAERLAEGMPVVQLARLVGVAPGTMYRYLAYTGLKTPLRCEGDRWARGIY
ncbi:MAG: invertase [Bacteroidetes bacterium]|nr:MAG: invertase [Bacteroidota bacterium]